MPDRKNRAVLSHVAFGTANFDAMKRWWQTVLEADVFHENEQMALLTNDDEPTRVALVRLPEGNAPPRAVRFPDHVAFAFDSLSALLNHYVRLRDAGVMPYWTIHHRPTTSFYYRDPDGNQVEFYCERFTMKADMLAAMTQPRRGPGVEFNADELVARLQNGEPENQLLAENP